MLKALPLPRITLAPDRAAARIRQFRKARLLAIGDVMLDRYLHGTAARISPEAPVPVVELERETLAPGGMANACLNAASLGARVLPVGVVGDDESGRALAAELASRGIPTCGLLVAPGRKTTVKTRIVAGSHQIARMDVETRQPIEPELEEHVLESCRRALAESDAVMVCDYAKGVLTPRVLRLLFAMTGKAGVPVLVDPKRPHFRWYRGATAITPNLNEAAAAAGGPIETGEQLARAAARLLAASRCEYLLVTLGEHGMALFGRNQRACQVASAAQQVFDVIGAGDTAIATLSTAVAVGATAEEAMVLANWAAGLVVQKKGTAHVTGEELLEAAAVRFRWVDMLQPA